MQLKFSLLDEEDLKLIETMLVRAGLRIFRQLARDGLFTGQVAQTAPAAPPDHRPAAREIPTSQWPVAPAFPKEPPLPPAPLPPAPRASPPEQPVEEETLEEELPVSPPPIADAPVSALPAPERQPPAFLRPPPADLPAFRAKPKEPPAPPAPPPRKKYRSVQQVCKTVADRPHGYILTEEAYEIMGGVSPSGQLSQYVNNKEVEALIVANVKPPTKGLPGRLMIHKESLLKRLELRDQNKSRPVSERRGPAQPSAPA